MASYAVAMSTQPKTQPVRPGEVLGRPGASQASRVLARVLDDLVRVPGTNFGIGLDGIVGLIPGVGDASTTVVAGFILVDAVRNKVPLPVLAHMGLNLGIDALLGYVPVIGDVADFAHRANRRNLRLLDKAIADREMTRQNSITYLLVAGLLVVTTIVVLVTALLGTIFLLWRLLFG